MTSGREASGGDRRLLHGGSRCHAFEPGPCLEPFEDLAGFGEQRFSLAWLTLADEPFAVLEKCDGEPEGEGELAELLGGGLVACPAFCEASAEALGLGVEVGRAGAGGNGLDGGQ